MRVTNRHDTELIRTYTRQGLWRGHFVDGYLSEAAACTPERVAVTDGMHTVSYVQLARMVDSLAAALIDLGVGPGEVVSWQLPNWVEAMVVHHASARIGAVSNPIIPIYRRREVEFILREAGSRVLFVPATFRGFDYVEMIRDLQPRLPDLHHIVVVRDAEPGRRIVDELRYERLVLTPTDVVDRWGDANDPVLLLYTSGTTADPKGVVHSHNTLDYENRSIAQAYGLTTADIVFMPSPVTHITGVLYGLQLAAMLGTTVVFQDQWDPWQALQLIQQWRCSFTVGATPFLHGLTYHPRRHEVDTSSLRVFACGGADVPPQLIRDADSMLGCRATRVYGSTEFPTLSTTAPDGPARKRSETDGRPIGAAECLIVGERGRPAPAGEIGELLVRGPEMFAGYLREPDSGSPFDLGGWFATGDLAAADTDGYLAIRGRRKDIIIRGGENLSVKEVEDLLFGHPGVSDVAVVAMPDPVLVEKACAYVVPATGHPPTLEELSAHLLAHGVAMQKLPERLEIVPELPRNLAGKVQKFRLREQIRATLQAELRDSSQVR
jgi:cyclohexanecarboxylate-CoA ligase